MQYIGRFAPTPSGELHLGSLFAALVSWLDARSQQGIWHLRIDDLDSPRVVPGAEDSIFRTLEAFGLYWDGPVLRQSQQVGRYAEVLQSLREKGVLFDCACSRSDVTREGRVGWEGPVYSGLCRNGIPDGKRAKSIRFRIQHRYREYEDRALGRIGFDLMALGGDFIVRRADGFYSYQLATVVDDAEWGVTDVVRGMDLLGSVPRQLELIHALGYDPPRYLHHPVLTAPEMRPRVSPGIPGREVFPFRKLGKSTGATPVSTHTPVETISRLLGLVNASAEIALAAAEASSVVDILALAVAHWNPGRLPAQSIPVT